MVAQCTAITKLTKGLRGKDYTQHIFTHENSTQDLKFSTTVFSIALNVIKVSYFGSLKLRSIKTAGSDDTS